MVTSRSETQFAITTIIIHPVDFSLCILARSLKNDRVMIGIYRLCRLNGPDSHAVGFGISTVQMVVRRFGNFGNFASQGV